MKSIFKAIGTLSVVAAALVAAPAQAVVVTFGGQTATDGSVTTSSRISANNLPATSTNYFVETFDPATRNTDFPVGLGTPGTGTISVASGCSFNSFNSLGVTTSGSGMGVQKGSTGSAAAPGGVANTTCFGFTPSANQTQIAGSVKVDYSAFQSVGGKIDYLGFFYGSIDTYNSIKFYSSGTTLVSGSGILSDGTITGQELLTAFNLASGNRENSNLYINLDFGTNETFSAFEFITTQRAFEVDNIVTHVVPEPESLALFGIGLIGLAATRRRKSA